MLNNRGFTLLESLLVLSIIVVITTLLLTNHQYKVNDDMILKQIEQGIYEAKLNSMIYKEKTTFQFKSSILSINSEHLNKEIKLKYTKFDHKKFSFNDKGHINKGGHVDIKISKKKYRLNFYLGTGNFVYE